MLDKEVRLWPPLQVLAQLPPYGILEVSHPTGARIQRRDKSDDPYRLVAAQCTLDENSDPFLGCRVRAADGVGDCAGQRWHQFRAHDCQYEAGYRKGKHE